MRRTTTTTGALALLKTCCSNPSVSLALHEFYQLLPKFCQGERNIKIVPCGFLFPPAPPEIRAERSAVVCLEKEQKWLIWSLIVECSHFRMFFDQHWTSSIWWSKPKLHKKEAPPQLTEARCRRCARGLYAGRPSRLLRCQGWGSAPWKEHIKDGGRILFS